MTSSTEDEVLPRLGAGLDAVEHVPSRALQFAELGTGGTGQVGIAEAIESATDGTRAGVVHFGRCEFEWELSGDEYVYVVDGELEVTSRQGYFRASSGDLIRLRHGETVTYRVEDQCRVFYVLTPGDAPTGRVIEGV